MTFHARKEFIQAGGIVPNVEFFQQFPLGQTDGYAMPSAPHVDSNLQFRVHGDSLRSRQNSSSSERLVYCAEPLFWRESAPSRKTLRMMRTTEAAIQSESADYSDGPLEPHLRQGQSYSTAAACGSRTSLRSVRLPHASIIRNNFDGRPLSPLSRPEGAALTVVLGPARRHTATWPTYHSRVAISSSMSASKPYVLAMNSKSAPMFSRAAVSNSLPFSSSSSPRRLNS